MNGSSLTATERVAAAMLYYFQAGADARAAVEGGGGKVSVPTPTDADLERIAEETGRAKWNSVLGVAAQLVDDAVATTERGVMDVVQDVVRVVKKGQDTINKVTGGARDIRDLAKQVQADKARSSK
jgi:hypothetical protein